MINRGQSGPDRVDRTKQSLVKWWHLLERICTIDMHILQNNFGLSEIPEVIPISYFS